MPFGGLEYAKLHRQFLQPSLRASCNLAQCTRTRPALHALATSRSYITCVTHFTAPTWTVLTASSTKLEAQDYKYDDKWPPATCHLITLSKEKIWTTDQKVIKISTQYACPALLFLLPANVRKHKLCSVRLNYTSLNRDTTQPAFCLRVAPPNERFSNMLFLCWIRHFQFHA